MYNGVSKRSSGESGLHVRYSPIFRASDFPLPWERILWSGRPGLLAATAWLHTRYYVTDFRVVMRTRSGAREIAVHDIDAVDLRQSSMQRLRGTSTLVICSRRTDEPPLRFIDIRQGPQLALVLQLFAADRLGVDLDEAFVTGAIGPGASDPFRPSRVTITAAAALLLSVALSLVALGHVRPELPVAYAPDDAIYPSGKKRSRVEIVAFMENEVMPFARRTLGPLKGGAERVRCETCHGRDGEAREWKMPAVQALPEPDLRMAGLELYNPILDAQIRNAIYGYLAEEDNQGKAAYMRGVVLPGMARRLNRPPYDFTQSYEYNRSRAAFGCYHCHRVQ